MGWGVVGKAIGRGAGARAQQPTVDLRLASVGFYLDFALRMLRGSCARAMLIERHTGARAREGSDEPFHNLRDFRGETEHKPRRLPRVAMTA